MWDLIKRSHKTEFGELINVLQNVWENMTGIKAEKGVLNMLEKSECDLDEISSWNIQEELTPKEIL